MRHVRAQYLQDWLADPEAPLSWRLQRDKAVSEAVNIMGETMDRNEIRRR